MARLRQETQALHAQLDTQPLLRQLLRTDIETVTYVQILSAYWSLYFPLETQLAKYTSDFEQWNLDFSSRRKISALAADLKQLGLSPQEIKTWAEVPLPQTFAEAWGTLYVLEGATLGAQIIRPILHKSKLPLQTQNFFTAYGTCTQSMWHSFAAALEDWSENNLGSEESITAARATFQAFAGCLSTPVLQ